MVTNSPWEACLIRLSWIISSELHLRCCNEEPLNEGISEGPGPLQELIETEESGSDFGYAYRVFDNEDILLELDGSNNIITRYTHGPGIDEPLVMERGGASFFYHTDGLGSITEITDSGGSVVQRYTYSSFGKIESQLDPNFLQPYTFTARELDTETGLYHIRVRTYDSLTGRFLQEDPIRGIPLIPGSFNLYRYAANNPIKIIDPTGEINVIGAGVGAGIGLVTGVVGSLAQGGSAKDVFVSGGLGLVTGAATGAFGPLGGRIAGALIGGGASILGQTITNPGGELNWGAVIGSAVGGALGADRALRLKALASQLGATPFQNELIGALGSATITTIPALIGETLGNPGKVQAEVVRAAMPSGGMCLIR